VVQSDAEFLAGKKEDRTFFLEVLSSFLPAKMRTGLFILEVLSSFLPAFPRKNWPGGSLYDNVYHDKLMLESYRRLAPIRAASPAKPALSKVR
jgi:hypothetical protein